jgi:hypothetical protein
MLHADAAAFRAELRGHRCFRCGGSELASAEFGVRTVVGELLVPRVWRVCAACAREIVAFVDAPLLEGARSRAPVPLPGTRGR